SINIFFFSRNFPVAVAQKHASLSRFDPRSKSNGGKTRALPKGDNLTRVTCRRPKRRTAIGRLRSSDGNKKDVSFGRRGTPDDEES
ncbi:hypothetical protein BaRGS_00015830, partial [Batillaria attramentaria]